MSNSEQENQLAVSAFNAIFGKYRDAISKNPSQDVTEFINAMQKRTDVMTYVKFYDHEQFLGIFNSSRLFLGQGRIEFKGCVLAGFTGRRVATKTEREIYINRQHANPGTVVHEMLHFLTHSQFSMYTENKPALVEAITEYFTRRVIVSTNSGRRWYSFKKPKQEFSLDQRKGRYDQFYNHVIDTRAKRLEQWRKDYGKGFLRRAYFEGDQKACDFVLTEFGSGDDDIQEMVESFAPEESEGV